MFDRFRGVGGYNAKAKVSRRLDLVRFGRVQDPCMIPYFDVSMCWDPLGQSLMHKTMKDLTRSGQARIIERSAWCAVSLERGPPLAKSRVGLTC